jgi:GntR family transcriptional regulator
MTDPQPRRERSTHYEQAKQELAALVSSLAREGIGRLPAEDELAERLGFSRPTVRSALLALQHEGKLERRHGVGTLINRHALEIAANLTEDRPFLDILTRLGHEATMEIIRIGQARLCDGLLERVGRPSSTDAVVIDRLFRASGRPAVLSRDRLPLEYLTAPVEELTAERSTFAFVRRWTGTRVRYSVAAIRAVTAPAPVSALLELPDRAAVLLLEHLHLDESDRPLGVTEAYVNESLLTFSVVRTNREP